MGKAGFPLALLTFGAGPFGSSPDIYPLHAGSATMVTGAPITAGVHPRVGSSSAHGPPWLPSPFLQHDLPIPSSPPLLPLPQPYGSLSFASKALASILPQGPCTGHALPAHSHPFPGCADCFLLPQTLFDEATQLDSPLPPFHQGLRTVPFSASFSAPFYSPGAQNGARTPHCTSPSCS